MIIDNILTKTFIKKEIIFLCKENNIPIPEIEYKDIHTYAALTDFQNNSIIFNSNLLLGTGIFKYYSFIEKKVILLSTIYHEFTHLKQYHDNINMPFNPISLGIEHPVITKETKYPFKKMKLYIESFQNEFLHNVYVLQPIEYEAFLNGEKILTKYNLEKYKKNSSIEKAIQFFVDTYNINNPILEISNALMNLYDNGTRPCSNDIQDLIIRCAICSYKDKNDFGVDKISILLGENYKKSLTKSYEYEK